MRHPASPLAIVAKLARFLTVGELYLILSAGGSLLIAGALLLLPDRLTTGPSLVTLYALAERETWGTVYVLVALVCAVGAWRPTDARFIFAITFVVLVQTAWAVGLTIPSLNSNGGVSNVLAPIAWLQLASTGALVGVVGRHAILPPCPPRASLPPS